MRRISMILFGRKVELNVNLLEILFRACVKVAIGLYAQFGFVLMSSPYSVSCLVCINTCVICSYIFRNLFFLNLVIFEETDPFAKEWMVPVFAYDFLEGLIARTPF